VDVQHPDVSGAEQLQMLSTRDQIAALESSLTSEERTYLNEADRHLIERTAAFYAELPRFVDLPEHRLEHGIDPARWWWYLDVIRQLPLESTPPAPLLKAG